MAKLFYTVGRIGPRRSRTPEGYLLCEAVPIARIGDMVYSAEELEDGNGNPVVRPDADGLVRISRSPEEVFRPETIASFNGKSVTNDHPEEGTVTPETWQRLTVGTTQNIRRGIGAEDDLLLADLLITTPEAIEAVLSGKKEVSCGYEADYEETGKGTGLQKNIIGNHVALVESGRCGWRCAIGDHKRKENGMATKGKKKSLLGRFMDAIRNNDDDELQRIEGELHEGPKETGDDVSGPGHEGGGPDHLHVHVHGPGETTMEPAAKLAPGSDDDDTRHRFTDDDIAEHMAGNAAEHAAFRRDIDRIMEHLGISNEDDDDLTPSEEKVGELLEAEAPVGTGDRARKATDSSFLSDAFRETASVAEIIAPGLRVPSFDRAAKPSVTYKKICGHRRASLDLAYARAETRNLIDEVMGGKPLSTKDMSCDAIRTVFKAVGAMARRQNNDVYRGNPTSAPTSGKRGPEIQSVKDLTRVYRENYMKK